MSFAGSLRSIHIGAHGAPLRSVESVRALERRGLEGDRYATGDGEFSANDGPQRQVTLIEVETLRALELECGIVLAPGDARRNLVTEGVPLNHLVGREFSVGAVPMRGVKLCEPCGYLQRLLGIDALAARLAHRAGLNAEVLGDGEIHIGDPIAAARADLTVPT